MGGRWIFVTAGLLTLLGLGSVYSWSVFRPALEDQIGLSSTQSLLPYTLALICYAAFMPVAGFFIERVGPRKIVWAGAFLVGAGYGAASFADSAWSLVLAYGLIAGSGVGIAYGVPLAVSASWFPHAKGLAIGITVIGFGVSPLVTAPVANLLIELFGIRTALALLGAGIFLLLLICSIWMKFPISGTPQREPSTISPPPTAVPTFSAPLLTSLLCQRAFYGLWICFALGTFVGLSTIGISVSVGLEVFALEPATAAALVALFAICNGASRPLFGWLTDRFEPWIVICALYGIVLVASAMMTLLHSLGSSIFAAAFCMLWLSLGGWMALAPTATMKLFPSADYARNYGVLFTAYGVGALLGTTATGYLRDTYGHYLGVFPLLGCVALAGMVCALALLPSKHRGSITS